jgi:modulator of FtsH protease
MTIASWANLFIAAAGAGAALAGLIIVAMSVNVKTILRIPGMTSRAATTIAVLTLMVLVTLAGLFPNQTYLQFGIVMTVCSVPVLALSLRSATVMINDATSGTKLAAAAKGLLGVAPTAMATAAGALLLLGDDAGLTLLGLSILVSIAASVTNAWVLLVEILR